MIQYPTFDFKGTILPIIDKTDRLYFFIKNELNSRVLLNIVSEQINKFVSIGSKSINIFYAGVYKNDIHLKIFYMGHELFDFQCKDIDKNSLLLYSNYIIDNSVDIDRTTFSLSFNNGIKLTTFSNKPQQLFIQIIDADRHKIIHEDNFMSSEPYCFNKNYYINYKIIVLNSTGNQIFEYDLNLKHKKVWVKFESKSLGDTLAWIPYVEEFRKKHDCYIECTTFWNNLFINQYPNISFVNTHEVVDPFATYKIQCSIPHNITDSPIDYRNLSLQEISSVILGLDHKEIKPLINTSDVFTPIDGDYVVIATMSTAKAKLWNNKNGWQEIIDYLNSKGLKVVILQKEVTNKFKNVINKSGIDDINQTIGIIKNCKFFIGLSSGLSWLAWTLNKKVVLISGFTNPNIEFKENCYRVINTSVCHGCWSDKNYIFDRSNWFWCPRNKQFECSTEISSNDVIKKINKLIETDI